MLRGCGAAVLVGDPRQLAPTVVSQQANPQALRQGRRSPDMPPRMAAWSWAAAAAAQAQALWHTPLIPTNSGVLPVHLQRRGVSSGARALRAACRAGGLSARGGAGGGVRPGAEPVRAPGAPGPRRDAAGHPGGGPRRPVSVIRDRARYPIPMYISKRKRPWAAACCGGRHHPAHSAGCLACTRAHEAARPAPGSLQASHRFFGCHAECGTVVCVGQTAEALTAACARAVPHAPRDCGLPRCGVLRRPPALPPPA